jgi:3-methyl-2-oxobutanoate hydroxymethyltransferase
MIRKITPEIIRTRKKSPDRITALTAYDYPTARILDETGIDLILVGDSLGMTILGYPNTTQVVLDDMIYHTRAVARGVSSALLAADLPFQSYRSASEAVSSAQSLVDAGAEAVKLEGGQACRKQIRAITNEGIPFLGHIGMLPQHVLEEGGYKIKGRTAEECAFLREEALAVQEEGAFAMVLELVEPALAAQITQMVSIPTIGIGSGPGCDGQILVFHDLVGYFPWLKPKHVKPEADLAAKVRDAALGFIRRVRAP